MLFSTREIDLLRLLRWCRYISVADMHSVFSKTEVLTMTSLKFITLYKKFNSYVLTKSGSRFLEEHLDDLPSGTRPSYRDTDTVRRLRAAKFALTAYRSGISLFNTDTSVLENNMTCYLTWQSRIRGFNPWGSSRTVALLHLDDTIYGVHYVCPGIGKISLTDELAALSNNTAKFQGVKLGLIFTGESYSDILAGLEHTDGDTDSRLIGYGDAYRELTLPVHLLACNDTGAKQLMIMSQPDCRKRLTLASLKSYYRPPPDGCPEFDAMYSDAPLVMAVDMDLRRIDAAIEKAKTCGLGTVQIVSTIGQANEILREKYSAAGLARVLTLKDNILGADGPLELYSPPNTQFVTPKGDVVNAPFIQTDRKAGGSGL